MPEEPRFSRRQLGGLVLAVGGASLLGVGPAGASSTAAGAPPRVHGQPYASNWFPADLVGWDPAEDPDWPGPPDR